MVLKRLTSAQTFVILLVFVVRPTNVETWSVSVVEGIVHALRRWLDAQIILAGETISFRLERNRIVRSNFRASR